MIQTEENILFMAFRYALGRKTYAVYEVTECIKKNWGNLSDNTKSLIKKEIKEAIKNGKAGDKNIDVPLWKSILELK